MSHLRKDTIKGLCLARKATFNQKKKKKFFGTKSISVRDKESKRPKKQKRGKKSFRPVFEADCSSRFCWTLIWFFESVLKPQKAKTQGQPLSHMLLYEEMIPAAPHVVIVEEDIKFKPEKKFLS